MIAELSCQGLVELVTDYLEGALSPRDRARFDEHLGVCPGCRAYLEQMQRTIALTGRLSVETLEEKARTLFLDALRTWRSH